MKEKIKKSWAPGMFPSDEEISHAKWLEARAILDKDKIKRMSSRLENRLSKFLQKSVSELKIEFGHPDLIEDGKNNNRILVYFDSKFKIKCERRFEIDPQNTVVGFSSKNCF